MIRPVMDDEQAKCYQWLIDLIPDGKGDAVSMSDLSKLTDLSSSDVRQQVLNARKVGVLICSGEKGYYFPADEGELKDYVFGRRKYIKTAEIALRAFEETLNRKGGDPS